MNAAKTFFVVMITPSIRWWGIIPQGRGMRLHSRRSRLQATSDRMATRSYHLKSMPTCGERLTPHMPFHPFLVQVLSSCERTRMKFLLLLHLIHALFVGCWVSRCSWELLQDSSFQLCHSTSHEEGLGCSVGWLFCMVKSWEGSWGRIISIVTWILRNSRRLWARRGTLHHFITNPWIFAFLSFRRIGEHT